MTPAAALEALAGQLATRGVTCRLAPSRYETPVLEASNPGKWNSCGLVVCASGCFRWRWGGEAIGPAADPPRAADVIARALDVPLTGKGR